MFLLLKELLPPDGLPARTHPLGRGVFNETPSLLWKKIWPMKKEHELMLEWTKMRMTRWILWSVVPL